MDQMKKAFKGLFRGKKSKKEEPKPTATSEAPAATPAQTKPTETTPAAPAPATAPEPAKTETTPAATSEAPAAPVPAPAEPAAVPASDPAQSKVTKDEAAALTEVKKATSSRLSSPSHSRPSPYSGDDACDGSRRRQKVDLDNQWNGPV
jgi:hypothetical protein